MKKIVSVCGFTFSSLTTLHKTNYDKNCLKCYNISIVLNINLLQYKEGNPAILVHYVTSHWAQRPKLFFFSFFFGGLIQRQSWKELIFYSKVFNISNASVSSHVESLGIFKKKYKAKKEKVRNHIHNSVQPKKQRVYEVIYRAVETGDGQRRRVFSKKKRGINSLQSSGDGQRRSCFVAPTLLHRRLLPFLLFLCFLSLQMRLFVFRPGIHLPAEIVGFRRYGRYFFRYEIRRLFVPVHWPVRYIPAVPTGTIRNWLSCN